MVFGESSGVKGAILRRKGFTLVELLVVIVLILILAGLVYSVASSAIRRGHSAVCAQQLRQIGVATQLYCEDHDGFVPPYAFHGYTDRLGGVVPEGGVELKAALGLYGAVDSQFYCPLDRHAGTMAQKGDDYVDNRHSSYLYSMVRGVFGHVGVDWVSFRISSVPDVSRSKHLFDSVLQPGSKAVGYGHGRMVNVLYYDGHVVSEDIHGWFCHFPGQNAECPL